jgi:large subunit ribosomal protein L13e
LKVYKSKLVLFPRKANKARKGLKKGEKPTKKAAPQRKDVSAAADVAAAVQQREQLPFVAVPQREKARVITADEKKSSAYESLVKARLAKRALGKKDKKEETPKAAGKKNADEE